MYLISIPHASVFTSYYTSAQINPPEISIIKDVNIKFWN